MPGKHRRKPKDPELQEPIELKPPREYVAEGGKWPQGPLVDNTPQEVLLAQGIACAILRYSNKPKKRSRREVARKANIGYQTLYNFLDGKTWPNIVTIARLEMFFNRRLFGNEHRPRNPNPRSGSA